jgi:hypothetical protein
MGAAVGGILPEAIGVAISPIPIIAVVLLLATPKGRGNSFAFLIAWLVGLTLIGTVVLWLADPTGANTDDGPAAWVGWFELILGVVAVLLGIKQFRGRPPTGEEPPMPKWMSAIDKFTAGRSATFGIVLSALNPKNLMLTLAAAATIATAGLDTSQSFVALGVFVVIGTLGVAIPIGIYLLGGDKAANTLDQLHHWLAVHNAAIMSILFVVIGAKLIGNGLQILL